jgi:hypothetical protein
MPGSPNAAGCQDPAREREPRAGVEVAELVERRCDRIERDQPEQDQRDGDVEAAGGGACGRGRPEQAAQGRDPEHDDPERVAERPIPVALPRLRVEEDSREDERDPHPGRQPRR